MTSVSSSPEIGAVADDSVSLNLKDFAVRLPKIELHAHINGSLSNDTLRTLRELKRERYPTEMAEMTFPDITKSKSAISEFFSSFKYIYLVTDDEDAVRLATRNTIEEFKRDGVRYLELRSTPRAVESTGMTKDAYVRAILDVLRDYSYDQGSDGITVRLILSVDRRNTIEQANEAVDLAIKYRDQGVVGVDLCGDVLKGSPDSWVPALQRAKDAGLFLTVHIGEVPENVPEGLSLLALNPDRLGHATHLSPEAYALVKERKIPVEACLTSNLLCKTVPSIELHHIHGYLRDGIPCIPCTDDKGFFFAESSDEYKLAAESIGLNKRGLFELSKNAIETIFASEEFKVKLRAEWDAFAASHNI
ncbi:Metallo-dependent hydrolase [Ramicandelaber brevisporus]|nr:Metallo-dependent hydrolase [Ramicandelaber brevisporus]